MVSWQRSPNRRLPAPGAGNQTDGLVAYRLTRRKHRGESVPKLPVLLHQVHRMFMLLHGFGHKRGHIGGNNGARYGRRTWGYGRRFRRYDFERRPIHRQMQEWTIFVSDAQKSVRPLLWPTPAQNGGDFPHDRHCLGTSCRSVRKLRPFVVGENAACETEMKIEDRHDFAPTHRGKFDSSSQARLIEPSPGIVIRSGARGNKENKKYARFGPASNRGFPRCRLVDC
jgi:hypothetical protein